MPQIPKCRQIQLKLFCQQASTMLQCFLEGHWYGGAGEKKLSPWGWLPVSQPICHPPVAHVWSATQMLGDSDPYWHLSVSAVMSLTVTGMCCPCPGPLTCCALTDVSVRLEADAQTVLVGEQGERVDVITVITETWAGSVWCWAATHVRSGSAGNAICIPNPAIYVYT